MKSDVVTQYRKVLTTLDEHVLLGLGQGVVHVRDGVLDHRSHNLS